MKCLIIFLQLNFFFSFSSSQNQIISEGETIEHCIEYNDEKTNCEICEDKYFPFFNNLICLPCNDSDYGQIGCTGKCNGSNFNRTHSVFCEEGGCKNGFYYLNGSCIRCPGCSNCTYHINTNNRKNNYKCYECESNEYILTQFGKCRHCHIPHCEKCHYSDDFYDSPFLTDTDYIWDLNNNKICDKCQEGYYISKNGRCEECREIPTEYG